jgi:hypothetical protein
MLRLRDLWSIRPGGAPRGEPAIPQGMFGLLGPNGEDDRCGSWRGCSAHLGRVVLDGET